MTFLKGPFKDLGYIKNIDPEGQDPAIFIDNGKPYLFWGLGRKCYAGQLTDDLMELKKDTFVELTDQLNEVFEGPLVHKYNNKYYLSYAALSNGKWPEEMYYATADNVLGPYTFQGCYIPEFEMQSNTNHGSIIKFKNDWIAFYHASWLSDGASQMRNIMADYLYYNEDGTIQPIIPSKQGINKGMDVNITIHLEAENAPMQGGKLAQTQIENKTIGFSGKGYVTGFEMRHDYLEVLVQTGFDMEANLKIRMWVENEFSTDILVGLQKIQSKKIQKTDGWEMVDFGMIPLKAGNNKIVFKTIEKAQNSGLKVDYIEVYLID